MSAVTKPQFGKVWTDPDGDQHYLRFYWAGNNYSLTQAWRRHQGKIIVLAISDDKQAVVWADSEGNFYGAQKVPQR